MDRRVKCEGLVREDVRDEPGVERLERPGRHRRQGAVDDVAGDLDDGVIGQERQVTALFARARAYEEPSFGFIDGIPRVVVARTRADGPGGAEAVR